MSSTMSVTKTEISENQSTSEHDKHSITDLPQCDVSSFNSDAETCSSPCWAISEAQKNTKESLVKSENVDGELYDTFGATVRKQEPFTEISENQSTSEYDKHSITDLPPCDVSSFNSDAETCSSPCWDISEAQKNTKESLVKSENVDGELHDTFGATVRKQEPITEVVSETVTKNEEMEVIQNEEIGVMQNSTGQPFLENNTAACNLSLSRKPTSRRKNAELQCAECTFQCASSEKLKTHVNAVHEQGETFACCLCSFESKWNREYYKHMRTHFPGPPYQCDFKNCTAKCERIQHLLYHRMNHTEERPFSCCFCSLRFKVKNTMILHLRKHTGYRPFSCTECSRSFSTKGALQQHTVTHSDKRAFLCDQCGFSTKHQSHLISHRRIHAGDVLQCELENCSYKTTKRSQLLSHMQSHLRIKTFFCEQCGQGFVAKSHLKRHQLTHVASKPFSCDYCDYSNNRKDKLRLHVLKHHGVSSDSTVNVRSKQRTIHGSRNGRFSELRAPEADNDVTSCVKFQKMVQKVDEQLNYRRLTKYTKVSHVELEGNTQEKCIAFSSPMESESSGTAAVEETVDRGVGGS